MKTTLRKPQLFFLAALSFNLFFISSLYGQKTQTFSTAGLNNFFVPAGVTSVTVQVWGGGGGGGRGITSGSGGAGGGGGAYVSGIVSVTPLTTLSFTVGKGGAGATTMATATNGTASVVSTINAGGGSAGTNGGANGGAGGAGSGGTTNSNGNNGLNTSGNNGGAGGNAANVSGGGGSGGSGGSNNNTNGTKGTEPGGGGGGGGKNALGGDGGNGLVIISYFAFSSVTATTNFCPGITSTVTVKTADAADLPVGTYAVGYTLSGANTGTATATLTVTTAGTGTFTTNVLTNPGATTVTITEVSNANVTSTLSANNSANITVYTPPTPIISVVETSGTNNNDGRICSGANATLTAGGGTLYTWSTGATTASINVTTAGTYSVTVKDNNNCTSVTNQVITVDPLPTVTVGSAINICQGGTTPALGGSFGGSATGAVWSDGGAGGSFAANTGSTPGTTTYTPPVSFAGPVTLTLTSTGSSCGVATATRTLTVNASPIVNIGNTLTAICQGGTSEPLGGTFSGGATAAVWSDGLVGGTFSNNTGATPNTATYTPPANFSGTVTLTLTTSGGSCGTVNASKTLTVNPGPTVTIGPAIAAICQGGTSANLGGSFSGGATAAVWSDGLVGGTFSNNTGATPNTATYTPPANFSGTVTLTLTTSGGSCGTVNASKTLTVNPGPTVTIGPAIAAICQGGTTTDLGGNYGGSAAGAVWSADISGGTFGDNTGASPGTARYTAPASYFGPVTLTLTTTGGSCGTTLASKTLTVNLRPSVSFSTTPTASVCTGSDVTYTTQDNGANYTWSIPGTSGTDYTIIAGGIGASDHTVTLRWLTTGNKMVTVNYANADGCLAQSPAAFTTTVYKLPTLTAVSASTTAICEGTGATITLTGLVPGVTQVINYAIQTSTFSATITSNGSGMASFITSGLNQSFSANDLTITSISYPAGVGCVYIPDAGISSATLPVISAVSLVEPTIVAVPADATVCAGLNLTASRTIAGSGGSGSAVDEYRYSTDNGATWSPTWTTTPPVFAAVAGKISKIEARRNDPNASGCKFSASTFVSWDVVEDPTVSGPQPAAQGLCINGPVVALEVTASGGTGSFSYQWYSNTTNSNSGGTLISGATSASYTPPVNAVAVTYYYCVVSQTGNGCGPVTSATAEVRVRPQPVAADIIPDVAAGDICAGQSVSATFNGALGGAITSTDKYEFSVDGGASYSDYMPGTAIPTNALAGKTVIIRSSRSSTGPGCNFSGYKTVSWAIIAPPVSPTLTKSITGTAVCSGTNVSASVATPGSGGNGTDVFEYRYGTGSWTTYVPGTAISTPGQTFVEIRAYRTAAAAGCTQSAPNSVAWTINTLTLPPQPVTVTETSGNSANDGVTCTGATVKLTASGGTSYAWNGGPATAAYDVTPSATTTYTVTVTGSNGCTATATQTITVNPTPTPTFTATPSLTESCQGSDVTYTTQPGQSNYQWTISGTAGTDYSITSGGTNTSNSLTLKWLTTTGTKTVTVNYKNANGCAGPTPASFTITSVKPKPATPSITVTESSGFSGTDNAVCAGASATLTATGVTGVTYSWSPGGSSPTGSSTIVSPSVTTNYVLTVTGANGCTATDNTTVAVDPLPTVYNLTDPNGLTTFCYINNQTQASLTLSGSNANYTYTFQPYNNGPNDPKGQPFNFTGTGSVMSIPFFPQNNNWCYAVSAVSPKGCKANMNGFICPTPRPAATVPPTFASCLSNSTATLTVSLSSTTAVQWQVNEGNNVWTNITAGPIPTGASYAINSTGSVTTTTLTITGVTPAMNGWQYRVNMTGQGPCGQFTSPAATLSYSIPIVISNTPLPSAAYCASTSQNPPTVNPLTVVVAQGNNLTYQWYVNTTNSTSGGSSIAGATGPSYTPPNTVPGTYYYYVVVTNACGSQTLPASVQIVINEPPAIVTQPTGGGVGGSASYCQNATATALTVSASGTGLTYQWYSNTTNTIAGGTAINGATSPSYIPPTTSADTVYYYVEVKGTCGILFSSVVPVYVSPPLFLSNLSPLPKQCYGSTVRLTFGVANANGQTQYQWYKNATSNNSGGTAIQGATTPSYTINSLTTADIGFYYLVVTGGAPCNTVLTSQPIEVSSYVQDETIWTAGNNTDTWHDDLNWTCKIPNLYRDAIVPVVPNKPYPRIGDGLTGQTRKLQIDVNGPSVTVEGKLQMAGEVTNNGILNGHFPNGTLEFVSNSEFDTKYPDNPTYTQRLVSTGGTPITKTQHLKISNLVSLTIPVDVFGRLSLEGKSKSLATGDGLTLKSVSVAGTAMVTDLTGGTGNDQGNRITGKTTVERFIPSWGYRKWRLLTAPVKDVSVNAAWQEGRTWHNGLSPDILNKGYGTLITGGDGFANAGAANGAGFDYWPLAPGTTASIRKYAGSTSLVSNDDATWPGLPSTTGSNFNNNDAYLLYIRGDRSYSTGAVTSTSQTILRPKGEMKEVVSHTIDLRPSSHTLIGNPFASPLNFKSIYDANSTKIQDYFWTWISAHYGLYGLGGYVLLKPTSPGASTYEAIPNETLSPLAADPNIHSGEGFFVVPKTGLTFPASITINQAHKTTGIPSLNIFRQKEKPAKVYANIYADEGNEKLTLMDGLLAQYGRQAQKGENYNIAKAFNGGLNFTIERGSKSQIVSDNPLPGVGDTLHLRLWNTATRAYQLKLKGTDFGGTGVVPYLIDKHLSKHLEIGTADQVVSYAFRITGEAGSKDPYRFSVVFKLAPLPPATLVAEEKWNGVQLNWSVPEDLTVANYELEKATDGTSFKSVKKQEAKRSADPQQYGHLDGNPAMVEHYRVKMTGMSGSIAYSNAVTVELGHAAGLAVYPNPVTGATASLQFTTKPAGRYRLVLFTPSGQQGATQVIQHTGGTATYELPVGNLASGTYTAEIHHPGGWKEKIKLVITH